MVRTFFTGLVLASSLLSSINAQEKQPPKKKERIALADPSDVAKDPDFAIQGEYVGEVSSAGDKIGVQVIARGDGQFLIKGLMGGLPGAGWNGKDVLTGTAERKDGKVVARMKFGAEMSTATIVDGKFILNLGNQAVSLARIERKSNTLGLKPPENAIVLFGKEGDESNWINGKLMELSDGKFLTVSKTGSIRSKEKFGAFRAHIEFRLPWMPNSLGQGRANSGVYLQDRYECQVLDSFGLSGENNECGGIYTQHKPLVNMCLPPMAWQTYDIEFTPAEFDSAGKKTKNARATIYHNGVKIHDNVEFPKECPGGQKEAATPGPLQFQDHGDPVIYRNVWVVPVR
jgi:hypothetical protein